VAHGTSLGSVIIGVSTKYAYIWASFSPIETDF
jgi:hypothetical protein